MNTARSHLRVQVEQSIGVIRIALVPEEGLGGNNRTLYRLENGTHAYGVWPYKGSIHVVPYSGGVMMALVGSLTDRGLTGWGNRGWVEIVEMILETCQKGALKTHIMYRSNLNSKQVSQYVAFLESKRLLDRHEAGGARQVYKTTERGRQYMAAYGQLASLFK